MIPAQWDDPDFESEDPSAPGRPLPTLVSLHFLRSALRRRWVACVLSAALGLLAAAVFLVAFPPSHKAEAVLVLAHDPQVDPERAISTDVSLLTTQSVAAQTITKLGLTMTAYEFLSTVTAVPESSDIMSLTLTAPTDEEAVRRLDALTSTYLLFRAEQLALQSTVVVDGMTRRIAELQAEAAELTERIDELLAADESAESDLSDVIAERTKLTTQIDTLEQSVLEATLRNASIASSRVIDAAAVEPGGMKRRSVLTLASGLIGGAALGCGTVLFLAITSDRLRRRFDVAAALEVTVPISVRRIAPLPRPWRRFPYLRAIEARRADERRRLAREIEMELPGPGQWGRLAVACIDNADDVRFALATAGLSLAADGCGVILIDLTEQGGLDDAVQELMFGQSVERPTVLRPRGIPALADNAADLRAVGHEDEEEDPPSPDLADVSLILADLDPSVGADHFTAWTERVIVVVTSGLSSVERVRTAGDMVRSAGLDLHFAALLQADSTDVSSGLGGSAGSSSRKPPDR
jgi:uncharacterized protein involved in exopolysaccharide biosynthesis